MKTKEVKITKVNQPSVIHEKEVKRIILPDGMALSTAIDALKRQEQEEMKVIAISESMDVFPWDGAHALALAMSEIYGWSDAIPVPGFFGDNPPQQISIEVEFEKTVNVTWGRFNLPGVTGYIETGAPRKNGVYQFSIVGQIQKRFESQIKRLADLTRKYAKEKSIYRSKAIGIKFKTLADGEIKTLPVPTIKFLDMSKIRENELVFSDVVMRSIRTSLFTPIERSAECRASGIPLKRGVLLAGPYGTGKTLAAHVTACKAVRNGWTYLYCQTADELPDMLKFAQQYQPAVIFCEDIDRVVDGERTIDMDTVLNMLDGVESKNCELMVVLTTNHVEKINKAMLRPGRLDAIINVLPPDQAAVEKLIRMYGKGLVTDHEDLSGVSRELQGKIPAVIREVVERAKLSAIALAEPGVQPTRIDSDALMDATMTMKTQLDLLNETQIVKQSDMKHLGDGILKLAEAIGNTIEINSLLTEASK